MAGPGATTHIIIAGFMIDCSIGEVHTFDNEVTDFPVESGSNIVDNIRPLPLVVEIEGFVSNTPIGLIVDERGPLNESGVRDTKPVDDAYSLFERIRDKREPVTIQTSLRTYDNMALERLSIPRGASIGDGLKFSATFKQIQYVTNKRTIRVSTPIAMNGTGKGGGKKNITKPLVPYSTRVIMIDRLHGVWWDPDVAGWRASAVYRQTHDFTKPTGFFSGPTNKRGAWYLYRQQIVKNPGAIFGGDTVSTEVDVPTWRRFVPTSYKQVIPVHLNQCVYDFVILSPPGSGLTNKREANLTPGSVFNL